jgi:hypothetical protein
MKDLKDYFKKVCINEYHSEYPDGELLWYRHPDLYALAKKAHAEGKKVFYAEETKNGIVEAEPRYRYIAHISLTEEEYNKLFKGL